MLETAITYRRTLDYAGRIVVPAPLRRRLGLLVGMELDRDTQLLRLFSARAYGVELNPDNGRFTLPLSVRDAWDVRPGDDVEFRLTAAGAIWLGRG